jgi:phosphatidate cytidylyltransferase
LLSAAIIVPVVLLLVWLDYRAGEAGWRGVWLMPLQLVIVGMGIAEVLYLFRAGGFKPRIKLTVLVGVLVAASFGTSVVYDYYEILGSKPPPPTTTQDYDIRLPILALAGGVIALFLGEIHRYPRAGSGLVHTSMSVFAITYVAVCFGFLSYLRLYGPDEPKDAANGWGIVAVVSMVAIVKLNDTGAYFTGRLIGRNKMTPVLSPKKTWEGAIGGIVVASLFSCLFFLYIAPQFVRGPVPLRPISWIIYAVILSVAGIFGDLAESLIKREMHQKDSSAWLPGLGGVLDIIDAVLFAAPVAYCCWEWKLLGV